MPTGTSDINLSSTLTTKDSSNLLASKSGFHVSAGSTFCLSTVALPVNTAQPLLSRLHVSTVPGFICATSFSSVVPSKGYSQANLATNASSSIWGICPSWALRALASLANSRLPSTSVLINGLIPIGSLANSNCLSFGFHIAIAYIPLS